MNIKDLTLLERATVRVAQFIMYTLIFALFATFIFLLTDAMINYLSLGQYNISTI
jgi:hypothetical protein